MTEVRKLWRDKASAGGSNPGLSIFFQSRRNHEPPQPYRRALLFVAAIFTFTMKFIAAIPIILAYGPAIFDLALTGRGVSRPTQTSTTDWALAQFYTLHTGKPSLAILPTGLGGAVLAGSDHNIQDSAVSIWATVHAHVTPRRALANVGTFITSFNRHRLYEQWRYIRGWWRSNSGRVIEEALIIYFYSLPLLAFILGVWRKRVLRQRRLEAESTATLVQPNPFLASSVAFHSLVSTDLIQTTQRNVYSSSCIQNVNDLVAISGTPTPSPFHLTHHLAFDFRACLRVVSTPTGYPAKVIPQQLLGVSTAHTGAISVYKKIRSGQEQVSEAPTAPTGIVSGFEAPDSGPNGSKPQRIVIITLVVLPQGFVIIQYQAVDGIAFWTVNIILNPGTSCASAVSRHASNIYRIVPKRTVTFRTRGLIEAGSSQFGISSIDLPTSRRLFHSNGLTLPRTSLAPEIVCRVGEPLPLVQEAGSPVEQRSSARVSPSFISIYSVEGVLVMGRSFIDEVLHWSISFFPRQGYHISQHPSNDGALLTQSTSAHTTLFEALLRAKPVYTPWISRLAGILALDVPGETVMGRLATTEVDITTIPLPPPTPDTPTAHAISDVEPEAQVALAPSADTDDATKVEEVEEEESKDNNRVEATFVPLPPSRPASPEADEVSEQDEEELLQATSIPLPDSRPGSPELPALDPSARDSDLRQHIATLAHQYLVLRAMLVQPVLREEARAIRAELRPWLCSLVSRARERRGLAPLTSVEGEPEGQQKEEVVVEEEAEEEEGEEVGEDLEIEPSTEDQDVGNVEDESRRPFRLVIPISVVRHISTNIH